MSAIKQPNESSEAEELAEVERRERQLESGEVQPIEDSEFWRRVDERRKL
jgi:hypothetical protein